MSRPLRIELHDGLYHVTSRGDRREPIFEDDQDRERFLAVLAQAAARFDAVVYAYCLMGNHYHFVLRTRQPNLSRLMRHLNGVYSQAFNRRHGIVGHLFQGRFKAIHVDGDAYFMQVCRYVELNPVRARLVNEPSAWKWSSYRAHLGICPASTWLDSNALLGHLLGRDPATPEELSMARARYEQLVRDGYDEPLWAQALRQDIYLGELDFIQKIRTHISAGQQASREFPATQSQRPCTQCDQGRMTRETAMLRAHTEDGHSLSSIAEAWGLSVSRVSRLVKKAERSLDEAGASGSSRPGAVPVDADRTGTGDARDG